MHRVTIRELRHRGGEVVDRARRGEQLTITRDGEAVAVLTGVPREAITLDELRRRGRRPDPGLPDFEHADDAYVAGRAARDPGDIVAAGLDVDTALAELPDEFKAPVVLRDMAGLDYAEIAEVLDLAPGTVRSRIARGRGRLADLLADGRRIDSAEDSRLTGNRTTPDERQSP